MNIVECYLWHDWVPTLKLDREIIYYPNHYKRLSFIDDEIDDTRVIDAIMFCDLWIRQ